MKSKKEIGEYDHKSLIIFRNIRNWGLDFKLWDATVSSSSYCFRFLLLREYSYSHWDSIISWFISYLTHWAVELTLPQTDILQVAWRQGSGLYCAGFVLNISNSCIMEPYSSSFQFDILDILYWVVAIRSVLSI